MNLTNSTAPFSRTIRTTRDALRMLDFERPKPIVTRALLVMRFSGSAQSKMPGIHVSDPE
jgi:hypothetical protein